MVGAGGQLDELGDLVIGDGGQQRVDRAVDRPVRFAVAVVAAVRRGPVDGGMVDQAGAVRTEEGVVRRGVLGGEGEALPEGAADGGPVVGVVDAARPGRAPVAAVATWAATVGVPVRVAAHSGREPTHRDARSPPRPTRASPSN